MLILVTAGAGFIGSHIVTALTGADHEVRVLDALLPAAHRTAPRISPGVDWRHADVRDATAVTDALRGVDAGRRVYETDVPYHPRTGRSKVTGTWQAVRDMRAVLAEPPVTGPAAAVSGAVR